MRKTVAAVSIMLGLASPLSASETPDAVDGLVGDWLGVPATWVDPTGDGAAIDFGRVWVRTDAKRVTLLLEVGAETSLQGGNEITLLIDGDHDASTGLSVCGIGAELQWTFGKRAGSVWSNGAETRVEQADIGLRQAPTVSSDRFEVSMLRRTAEGTDVIPGPSFTFLLVDQGTDGGDRLPDAGSVSVGASEVLPPAPAPPALERQHADDIRVLTWNVLFDGLFKRPAPFLRVLRAIDPDVICFQEIWSHTAQQAADQVSLALPEATWYGGNTTEGHIVARYPLIESRAIDEAGNYWALVDLPDERYATDLSIVSAHPVCCDKEEERQEELDGIAAWLRDLTTPGGTDLPKDTPIVVAGDMNLVGGARQVRTLLAGEIVNEERFGASHPPDWDGTPLADAHPRLAGGWDTFTWRDSRSSFSPGRLDYIVYSDSVLRLGNAFVLDTEILPQEALERHGLRPLDTLEASDHLPVVADFTPLSARSRTEEAE